MHQVSFVFVFDGSELDLNPSAWEAHHRFRWVDVDELPGSAFTPQGFVPYLRDVIHRTGVEHVVIDSR